MGFCSFYTNFSSINLKFFLKINQKYQYFNTKANRTNVKVQFHFLIQISLSFAKKPWYFKNGNTLNFIYLTRSNIAHRRGLKVNNMFFKKILFQHKCVFKNLTRYTHNRNYTHYSRQKRIISWRRQGENCEDIYFRKKRLRTVLKRVWCLENPIGSKLAWDSEIRKR